MAEFPALPLFTDAYLSDTRHLTAAQHGAYVLLLMMAWRTPDCALPNDDEILARWACMDRRTWMKNKHIILSFWKLESIDGAQKFRQARLFDERKYVEQLRNKNAANGRASALKRKERHSTVVQPKVNQTSTPTPTPTPIEDTSVSSPPTPQNDPEFETFWEGWRPFDMDKGSKAQAKKFYNKARKEISHGTIIEKRDQYLESCHRNGRRTTHASTWLNPTGRRGWDQDYTDSPDYPTGTQLPSHRGGTSDDKLRHRVNATARQIDDLIGD